MEIPIDNTLRVLTVDIGNTAMKVGVYEGERLIASLAGRQADPEMISMMWVYYDISGVVYSCVGEDKDGIADGLREMWGSGFVELTASTPVPLEICYGSRPTLGVDRIAAAVGAMDSRNPVLVVDAGTAVTMDLVADGKFLGGNISPGLRLRFDSLHNHTSRLPALDSEGEIPLLGKDTATAIRAGVAGGLAGEISNLSRELSKEYPGLRLILTGGDAETIAPLLRRMGDEPELDPALLGRGLVKIYNYNRDL